MSAGSALPPPVSAVGPGRVALVTGGNRGIGLAVCEALARDGTRVYLGCRDPQEGAAAIERRGIAGATPLPLQLTDPAAIAAAVARIGAEAGGLDALVNNAGVSRGIRDAPSVEPMAKAREAFEVNFFGAWQLIQHALPLMRGRPGAHIVNVSSGHGSIAKIDGNNLGYRGSKAALNIMTLAFARELDGSGIRINAMTPGWVRTRLGGIGAPRTPEQGAETILWLLRGGGGHGGFYKDRETMPW